MEFKRNGVSKLNERYFRLSSHEYTVYVEGDKDCLFWDDIFPEQEGWTPRIEVVKDSNGSIIGGWLNLINYLDNELKKGNRVNFIIAQDGDYNEIIHHKKKYNNVVTSKKYSLENYIFCPISLNHCIKRLSFGAFDNKIYVENKLLKFAKLVEKLILLDCINEKEHLGYNIYNIPEQYKQSYKNLRFYVKTIEKQYCNIIKNNKFLLKKINTVNYIRWKPFIKKLVQIIYTETNKAIKKENVIRTNNLIRKLESGRGAEDLYQLCLENCKLCKHKCEDYNDLISQANTAFLNLIKNNI